jgi:hypothetical protein
MRNESIRGDHAFAHTLRSWRRQLPNAKRCSFSPGYSCSAQQLALSHRCATRGTRRTSLPKILPRSLIKLLLLIQNACARARAAVGGRLKHSELVALNARAAKSRQRQTAQLLLMSTTLPQLN